MSGETTIAEAARRHGVSTESINRWRNRFADAGKAAMEDGMPGGKGAGRFRDIYNRIRPHQSVADRTPRVAYLGITGGASVLGHGCRDTAPGGAYGTVRPRGLRGCTGRSACAGDRSLPYAASAWRGGQPALGVV